MVLCTYITENKQMTRGDVRTSAKLCCNLLKYLLIVGERNPSTSIIASKEHLCKRLKCEKRTLQRGVKVLRGLGLILPYNGTKALVLDYCKMYEILASEPQP